MKQPASQPSPRERRRILQERQALPLLRSTRVRAVGSLLLSLLGIVLVYPVFGSPALEIWASAIVVLSVGSLIWSERSCRRIEPKCADNSDAQKIGIAMIATALLWCFITLLVVAHASPIEQLGWILLATVLSLLNVATGAGVTRYHSASTALLLGPSTLLLSHLPVAGFPLTLTGSLLTIALLFLGREHDKHYHAKLAAELEIEELSLVLVSMQERLADQQRIQERPLHELLVGDSVSGQSDQTTEPPRTKT